jgi:Tetratricopeptide repeat
MHRPHVVTTSLIFAAIAMTYAVLGIFYPMAYIWATYEDLLGEWTQFWLFVVTFVVSARLVLVSSRYRLTFAGLALCCLYVAMEEISWGQRIFGFTSPDFFKANNLQSETNLHNFVAGPFSTTLKASLGYILAGAMATYGLIYPLLLRRGMRIARWFDARGVAAPPLSLAPFFVLAAILETSPVRFNEAEIAELLVGFGVCFTAIHYAFALKRHLPPQSGDSWSPVDRSTLAVRIGVTTILILSIAGNTALGIYATEEGRGRIDKRIENGLDKFARRYGKYGQWDTALMLLRRLEEKRPTGRATLRKLADALSNVGQQEEANAVLRRALQLDLDSLAHKPRSTSTRRSLVRTYRAMGDFASADAYAQEALEIGLERVEKYPDSANAAYSLGRTYSLLERRAEALEQLERAYRLKPSTKTFKKAYLQAKHNK